MRLAFLDLPDDRVDLISVARQDPEVEIVLVVHPDPEALALKIAEVLQIRHSTEPLDLLQIKPDRVALPALDAPSAAALVRAGISERFFITLEELASGQKLRDRPAAPQEPAPIDSWETLFDEAAGSRLEPIREALALSEDRQRLFREILALAVEQTGAESGSIMIVDEKEQELRIAFADGLSAETVRTSRQKLGEGVAGTVARDGKPLIINERIHDPRFREGRERSRICAAMSVPIQVAGRTIGVLNVSSDRPGARFHEAELGRLTEIGQQISAILERVIRGMRRDLDATEFRARQDIEDSFAIAAAGLEERLRSAALCLRDRLDAEAVTIHLTGDGGRRLQCHSSAAAPGETVELPLEGGVLARALADQQAYFLGARNAGAARAGAPPNLLAAPLTGTRPLGVLAIECVRRLDVDLEDFTRLATRIAGHLARMIERHLERREAERQSALWSELADAAARLMVARDDEALVVESLGTLRTLFPRGLVTSRLRDLDGEFLLRTGYGGPVEVHQQALELEAALAQRMIVERKEILSPPTALGASRDAGSELGPYALVPIRMGDDVVGGLGVLEPTGRTGAGHEPGLPALEMQALRKLALYLSLAVESRGGQRRGGEAGLNDPVTGLLAGEGFEMRLQEEVKRAERYHERFLLTLCSIAEYDRLRVRHGDPWAESFLREFAQALAKNVREVDAVARIAGGRFVVLSPATVKDHGALLRRLDALVPRLRAVQSLGDPDEVRMIGRQFTFPDEITTRGELLALIRSEP